MASTSAHLARSAGRPPAAGPKEKESIGVHRKVSITEPSSPMSKIPTSSWFSRSKHPRQKERPSEVAREKSQDRSENRFRLPSAESASSSKPQGSDGHGLGISASTSSSYISSTSHEPRQRNVLRRKMASADQHRYYARTETSSASSHEAMPLPRQHETASTPGGLLSSASESIFGLALPTASTSTSYLPSTRLMNPDQATSSSRMAVYQNRKEPQALLTQNLPPATSSFAQSSGSSTRRSESPGSLSRTSTPTSMSSYSPSISLPTQSPLKIRLSSPARSRPPVTRWRIKQDDVDAETRGLAAVRESITSSSSSSTVKATERSDNSHYRQTTQPLSPPPPSPPFRAMSTKQAQFRDQTTAQRNTKSPANDSPQPQRDLSTHEADVYRSRSFNPSSHKLSAPPPRPSREGTPKLDDYIAPSPVIHSNLSRLVTTGHKRRESSEKAASKNEGALVGRTVLGRSPSNASTFSARPSRLPSPGPTTGASGAVRPSQTLPSETSKLRSLPSVEPTNLTERTTKDPNPLSAGSSKSSARFGIFSKRSISPMEPSGSGSADRASKKGPVAGTGHEGYGKYARRGRSGSISTSASRGRSTSTSGTASSSIARTTLSRNSSVTSRGEPDMDEFLLERLAPVVISGGGMVDNRTMGPEQHQYSSSESSSGIVANDIRSTGRPPIAIQYSRNTAANTKVEEARRLRRESRSIRHGHDHASDLIHINDESDFSSSRSRPALAVRRSLHRSQIFKEAEPITMPAPINTQILATSPIDSRDREPTSGRTTNSTMLLSDEISEGREGNWLKPKRAGERARSPKKWNFFQRALASPKKSSEHGKQNALTKTGGPPATVSRLQESRPLPYYAIIDANEQGDPRYTTNDTQIDRTMQNDFGTSLEPPAAAQSEHSPLKQDKTHSMLLRSPPKFPAGFAITDNLNTETKVESTHPSDVTLVSELMTVEPPKPRKPRLQQIGRIPRVVSKRDRLHNPPPQSFSRPFARLLPQIGHVVPTTSQDFGARQHLPAPTINTEMTSSDSWRAGISSKLASAPAITQEADEASRPVNQGEFLTFPSRKLSEISASSSSGGGSFAAAVATTAILPEPHTAPGEDEIWNEYNDFLDTVESPAPLPEVSLPEHDHMHKTTRMAPAPLYIRKEAQPNESQAISNPVGDTADDHGLPSPPPMSKLLAPRQSAETASSPMSFSDFFAGYADRNRVSAASKHQSYSSGSHYSTDSDVGPGDRSDGKRHTQIMAEKTEKASALLTSGSASAKRREAGAYDSPSNHRQIYHVSIAHPFPFPKGFFTAAVFRFPIAGSESTYISAIAEFKRVLQPGGYLELSILDLDMVNMGNRTRNAVRQLKVKMQQSNSEVSLKPNSDNFQKMLGRRGFENLKSCMVDVPVAGHISSSRAGSFDSKDMSLGDMLRDSSARGDESITKMVSKVGRWWYTRCYEAGLPSLDDTVEEHSMWDDKQLLKECEKRETGLKLLICHAQKPVSTKRRTVSM
ncbi:hypothetical protein G7Y79_00045g081070 [Physcia stellaris]|nr:hypothetical protein G7Y79_00045g081070 [Physcia stellaris]